MAFKETWFYLDIQGKGLLKTVNEKKQGKKPVGKKIGKNPVNKTVWMTEFKLPEYASGRMNQPLTSCVKLTFEDGSRFILVYVHVICAID